VIQLQSRPDVDQATDKLKGALESIEPLMEALAELKKAALGKSGSRMARDVALSKLMFRRIESLSNAIIMSDLGDEAASVHKLAANISKMARDTIKALEGDESHGGTSQVSVLQSASENG
jgi:hypothetical protein